MSRYKNALGEFIPDSHFENDAPFNKPVLSPEAQAKLDKFVEDAKARQKASDRDVR
jgi:hypothetical protein